MKKLIALMLSILMVCSLAACASKQDSASASTETASTEASGEEKTPQSNNADWLGEAPTINESDIVETIDTEVLVVGAGCSGLVAANFSAAEGAKFAATMNEFVQTVAALGENRKLEDLRCKE